MSRKNHKIVDGKLLQTDKKYMGSRMNRINKIYGQIQKEERMIVVSEVQIEALAVALSVCKVSDYSQIDINTEFCFVAKTKKENSLVYPTSKLPNNIIDREDGWQAMRIKGVLDFSYIGIIAGITATLAKHAIAVFVISTFNTDYILVKAENLTKALEVLKAKGYSILEDEIHEEETVR